MAPRVFLITGTSTGFGYELVKVVLSKGDIAVATARNPDKLSFEGTNKDNYLALPLDVTSKKSIDEAFSKAVSAFGRVDVLVNNAGYGLSGEFESYTDEQCRTQMEVNFFGLIDCTRKGLEQMKAQNPKGGVIQQVTSVGGQLGVPLFSLYCASKWAIEGFSEAVSKEVKPEWNIKFTNIEPGPFRTDWSGRSMVFGEKKTDYDHLEAKKAAEERHDSQPGDPKRAAQAMYKLAVQKDPPLRVALGGPGAGMIDQKLKDYQANYDKYKDLAKSCDFPEGE